MGRMRLRLSMTRRRFRTRRSGICTRSMPIRCVRRGIASKFTLSRRAITSTCAYTDRCSSICRPIRAGTDTAEEMQQSTKETMQTAEGRREAQEEEGLQVIEKEKAGV